MTERSAATDAQNLDIREFAISLGCSLAEEILPDPFIRQLSKQFGWTFEHARLVVHRLIDAGELILTSRYTIVVVD